MPGGELPPVVAEFVANVSDFVAKISQMIAATETLRASLDTAAANAESFGAKVSAASSGATAAMDTAASAAKNQEAAEVDLAAAIQAAAAANDWERVAALGNAVAMNVAAAAARNQAVATAEAAVAQKVENAATTDSVNKSDQIVAAMNRIAKAQRDVAASARAAGVATSFWQKHFSLWGGMFGKIPILGIVTGLELVLHAVTEFLAVLIPALAVVTVGLLAWGAAAVIAGMEIYHQFQNAAIVSNALNQTVAPLSGSFQNLANSVRPQVYELFGQYMDAMAHKSGVLNQLIQLTGRTLDRFGAELEVRMAAGGSGLKDFFKAGEADAVLFAHILGNVAHAFMTILHAATQTHIAEILLSLVAAASNLLNIISKIPAPLLTVLIGLHGIVLWGGLAVTQLRSMALAVAQVLGKIGLLNAPMTAFAQAIGASADELAAMGSASPALRSIASDISNSVPGAYQMAQAYKVSDANLGKLVAKTPSVEAAAKAVGASAQDVANFAVAAASAGVSVEELAAKSAGGADKLAELTHGLESGAQNAANLALAFRGTGKTAVSAEEAVAGVGEAATATAADTSVFAGALSGLEAALPGGPIAWVIALGVALTAVGVYLGRMPDTTQRWINSLNDAVNTASNLNIVGRTISSLAANTEELALSQRTATGNATELTANQAALSGELQQELVHVGQLQKAYGVGMPQALALLQTAGVKAQDLFTKQGHVWQVDQEMVHGLVSGYQAMGQSIGMVGSDMNVLLVTESQQLAAMQKINQAYDQFTAIVSGPTTAFLQLDSGLITFQQDAKQAGATMDGLGTTITKAGTAASAGTATLSNAAVQLQQQFQQVYTSVTQAFDAFRNAQALSGGKGDFTRYVKDAVAALIPLAGANKAAAAEVSTLAQEAGGPATTSLSALAKWAGHTKNPLMDMYNASQQATVGASNLNQDASILVNTLQNALSPALAQATMTALGGQKALAAFADDLLKLGPANAKTLSDGRQVAEMFLSVDRNTKSAEAQFVGWAESLGLSSKKATDLWLSVSKGEKPLQSVRRELASTAQAAQNLGKPGLWGQIEHVFMAAWDGVFNWFKNSLPHAFESAWNTAYGFLKRVFTHDIPALWDGAWSHLVSPVAHAFDEVKRTVESVFMPWWQQNGSRIESIARTAWNAVKIIITVAWTSVMSFIGPALQGLLIVWRVTWSVIKAILKITWDGIVTFVRVNMAIVMGIIRTSITTIISFWRAGWDVVKSVVQMVWDVILIVIKTALGIILNTISLVMDILEGHWRSAWHDVMNIASIGMHGVVNVIKTVASGFIHLLYSAGRDLVQGLINGIKSLGGMVGNVLHSIVGGAMGVVKSILGIGSPSREAHYWGEMIGEGLTRGMISRAGEVHIAARRLAAGAMLGLGAPVTSPLSSAVLTSGRVPSGFGVGGSAPGGDLIIQVDGQQLLRITQAQLYRYNIRNSGAVTGILKPM